MRDCSNTLYLTEFWWIYSSCWIYWNPLVVINFANHAEYIARIGHRLGTRYELIEPVGTIRSRIITNGALRRLISESGVFGSNVLLNRPVCTNCESRLVLKIRNESTFAPRTTDSQPVYRCYRCFNSFRPPAVESWQYQVIPWFCLVRSPTERLVQRWRDRINDPYVPNTSSIFSIIMKNISPKGFQQSRVFQ